MKSIAMQKAMLQNLLQKPQIHKFLSQGTPCGGHPLQTRRTIRILENPNYGNKDVELLSLQNQMLDCMIDGAFEKGLKIALDAIDRYPEKPTLTHSWAVDFYMSLGRKKKAMEVLEQGLRRGAWWSPKSLRSSLMSTSLKELEDYSAFSKILKIGEKRFKKERQHARAELIVRTPKEYSDEKMHPLLLVLHGNHCNTLDCEQYWLSILDRKRLFLASLQSSQIVSGRHFVWDDRDIALRDVESAYSMLAEQYRIDTSKVILGGISAGAEIALIAIFSNRVPVRGFISVIPSVGAFVQRFVKSDSLQKIERSLKGCIVAGEKDPGYNNTKLVYEFLSKKSVPIQFYSYPELGHSIPDDFDQVLAESIKFILEE